MRSGAEAVRPEAVQPGVVLPGGHVANDLGPGFLRRVRSASLLVGALGILALTVYGGWKAGAAAASGLTISVVNLRLLEELFRRLLTPELRSGRLLALVFACKLPLLVGGTALALGPLGLSPLWYAIGFSTVLLVAVLKVVGILLTRAQGRDGRWQWPGSSSILLLAGASLAGGGLLLAPRTAFASGEGVPELPNLIHLLYLYNPDQPWAKFLNEWQNPIFSTLVIVVLCVLAGRVYTRRAMVPSGLQNAVEAIVEGFSNFILGILGPRGKEFIPFLGTLFLYIWFNNLAGLIPFSKAPTSVFNTTISLGICVFCYVQYTGISKLGLGGYLHHLLGSPRDVMGWAMVPLMLPLHLIEEIAKPVSLSLRLFGNIMGEDVLLGVFAGLGVAMLAFMKLPIGVPLHLPFIFLAILLSTIQALVFTLLSTIYFLQMLPHEDHGEEEHAHP